MDIVVTGLTKSFQGNRVLANFSCRFAEGKTTCIMGASGSGKTTLLHILLGIIKPDEGTVKGVPYGSLGAVFQELRLCENVSAMTNLKFICGKEKQQGAYQRAMLDLNLEGAFDKPVKELSGGMKQRVAILRAMLADASCIMMDEPLKGLDDGTKEITAAYIRQHTIGKTVIVITHDEKEVQLLKAEQLLHM